MAVASVDDQAPAYDILTRCRQEHSADVEAAWQYQQASATDERAAAARAVAACMIAAGIEGVGEAITGEQQRQWLGFNGGTAGWTEKDWAAQAAHARCLRDVEQETGFRP